MAARFYLAAVLFHAGVVLCAALIARRWTPEAAALKSAARWWGALLRDTVYFGGALGLFAIGAGLLAPPGLSPFFAMARFLCQGLFGEGILIAVWVATAHFRAARWTRAGVPALLATALLFVYFEAYHRCPYDLQVRHYALDLSHGRSGAQTLRIVHLSDIQANAIGPYEERALRTAKEQQPDLIVFTGDYVQPRLAPTRAQASADLAALLRRERLRAPLGIYAVEGDVDAAGWQRIFDGLGATCLVNACAKVALPGGRSVALVGLGVRMSRGNDSEALARLLADAPPSDLRIVLGHSPDFVRVVAGLAGRRDRLSGRICDLALAGHTHGGQVVLPLIGPLLTLSRLPRRYAGGLHDFAGIPLHVSRGIGMERGIAPQVRLLCPPEVGVLDVRY